VGAAAAGGNDRRYRHSAAADRDDDFQAVTIPQCAESILAARHDFAVALHGDAPAGEAEFVDQFTAVQ